MTENYCFLYYNLRYPCCNQSLKSTQGHMRFMWGRLGVEYNIGDKIRWGGKADDRYLEGAGRLVGLSPAVVGSSDFSRILAFDCDDNYTDWTCNNCHSCNDGPAAVIVDNRIVDVHFFGSGEVKKTLRVDLGIDDIVYFDVIEALWKIWKK